MASLVLRLLTPLMVFGAAACAETVHFRARELVAIGTAPAQLEAGLLTTTALVGGRPEKLVLDVAGTHALMLPRDALAASDARPTGEVARHRDAVGHAIASPVFVVPVFAWSGATWRDVTTVEARWSDAYPPPLRAGVIGRPLLRAARLTVMLGDGQVILGPSEACAPDAIPFELDGGIVVRGTLDGRPARFLVDTAATAHIATSPAFAGPHEVHLGARDLGAITFESADLPAVPADVILGSPLFTAHRRVVIDFGARCLRLVQRPASP